MDDKKLKLVLSNEDRIFLAGQEDHAALHYNECFSQVHEGLQSEALHVRSQYSPEIARILGRYLRKAVFRFASDETLLNFEKFAEDFFPYIAMAPVDSELYNVGKSVIESFAAGKTIEGSDPACADQSIMCVAHGAILPKTSNYRLQPELESRLNDIYCERAYRIIEVSDRKGMPDAVMQEEAETEFDLTGKLLPHFAGNQLETFKLSGVIDAQKLELAMISERLGIAPNVPELRKAATPTNLVPGNQTQN